MRARDIPGLLDGLSPGQRISELVDQCYYAILDAAQAIEACAEDPFVGLPPRIARADGAILRHLVGPSWLQHPSTHLSNVIQVVVNMCERWENIATNHVQVREYDEEKGTPVGSAVEAAQTLDNAILVLLLLSEELLPRRPAVQSGA